MKKIKLMIDPGHGGHDSGAIGSISQEKDLTLMYGLDLYFDILNENKIEPYITRNRDMYVSLHDRVLLAKEMNVDCFVSIHCNSFITESPNDSQVYYYNKEKDKPFADMIFTFIDDVNHKTSKWSGVKFGDYQVLREFNNTQVYAILIELGFISNREDEKMLNSFDFQKKMVKSIHNGIKSFFLL